MTPCPDCDKRVVTEMEPRSFAIGDLVEWTSQAGGHAATKAGRIVAVVPPGEHAQKLVPGCGLCGRGHESYVVRVGSKNYWPNAKHLRRVGATDPDPIDWRTRAQALEAVARAAETMWTAHGHTSWCANMSNRTPGKCDCGFAELSTALAAARSSGAIGGGQ